MEQKRINFDSEYVEAIIDGRKVTTVRKGIKRYPVGRIVDLTADNKPFARARVDKVVVKRVKELTDDDAKLDGFESREELIEALKRIYGKVRDEEFVTVVHFTVVE
ncbi:ASCH domain [Geoglobus ahangari]|uniref:ASCH domain n=1 Tax=Geoglobus ahangari TaxID=113653 RepID=A0A0F7ID62_9EURY|nr:ASCH domain-containing protein [Geoglobus ahangari]AKG90859.1 ASCH domain [Geoglobus ahangari]NOY10560.1 ASCH domain-containing protein [Archaeoglobi archaeon]